jgi:hypothetical protein
MMSCSGSCVAVGPAPRGHFPKRVHDQSYCYTVALTRRRVERLRAMLGEACWVFGQKCIYLSVAGRVEFVEKSSDESR